MVIRLGCGAGITKPTPCNRRRSYCPGLSPATTSCPQSFGGLPQKPATATKSSLPGETPMMSARRDFVNGVRNTLAWRTPVLQAREHTAQCPANPCIALPGWRLTQSQSGPGPAPRSELPAPAAAGSRRRPRAGGRRPGGPAPPGPGLPAGPALRAPPHQRRTGFAVTPGGPRGPGSARGAHRLPRLAEPRPSSRSSPSGATLPDPCAHALLSSSSAAAAP